MKEAASTQSRRRDAGRAPHLFACLLAALAVGQTAVAQSQTRPAAGGSGVQTAPAAPARPAAVRDELRRPEKPAPPVIAVVHRLRGWKLRALVTPPDAPFTAAFDDKFVRASVVAGYVMPDGRSVVARLPRAEAEMLNISSLFPDFNESPAKQSESGLVLMKQDGAQVPLKFVGFDSATGLSLLEATEEVLKPQTAQAVLPAVGERLRLVAPLPDEVAEALAATEVRDHERADGDQRPVGVSGVLYMSLAEIEGRLKEVNRSPAGRAVALTLQVEHAASPEWAGSIALTETGALAGIVEESRGGEARLLAAEVVRAAAERVKKRRASVPQPWLGARGDAVAGSQIDFFVSRGWPRAQAGELLRRRQGVMLTAVAPDSPAARAGLRPGDVVARIDNFEVRGVEDMSLLLREAGGSRPTEFTVHRANESPRSFRVRLSESQNPALETARAEARAAEAETREAKAAARRLDDEVRRLDEQIGALDESLRKTTAEGRAALEGEGARRAEKLRQLEDLRRRLRELHARQIGAEYDYVRSRRKLEEANARLHAMGATGTNPAFRPLLPFGVKAMLYMASTQVGGREEPDHGLVVLEVSPDSPAGRAGLVTGDVIESIDGQTPHSLDLSDRPPADLAPEPALAVRRSGRRLTLKLARLGR